MSKQGSLVDSSYKQKIKALHGDGQHVKPRSKSEGGGIMINFMINFNTSNLIIT